VGSSRLTTVMVRRLVESRPQMKNDLTKRLMWTGLLAGVGALSSIVANRLATEIWLRVFKEDPPLD
jgi:hypothetical protein